MPSVLRFLLSFIFLCLLLCGAQSRAQTVLLVHGDAGEAFAAAADALTTELTDKGLGRSDIRTLRTEELDTSQALPEGVRVVVTLGTSALRGVLARPGRLPLLVAAMVPRLGYERVLADQGRRVGLHAAAVYLDQPLARQLDVLRLALPKARTLGVVWGPESVSQQAALTSAAQARELALVSGFVTPANALGSALRTALAEADALIAVPDAEVYNSNTVSNVLITSYRAGVPVIAFSPSYVRAGALLSLHTTPAQAGKQSGVMVHHYLQGGALPSSQYPQDFEVTVNELVARSLGLSLNAPTLRERLKALEKRP